MKKIISLFVFIFIFKGLNAQEIHFGIKGGANFTFFKTDELQFGTKPDMQTGYYAGIFTEFSSNKNFSFQPEILYVAINDFNFLNIPLYIKYEVARNLHLMVGPSMNYFFDFLQNKFKVGGDLSTSFNITSEIYIHIKYLLGFEVITPNGIFLGLGIKL